MLDEQEENIGHWGKVLGRYLEVASFKCFQDELVEDMQVFIPVLGNIADEFSELGKVEHGNVKLVVLESINDLEDHPLRDQFIITEQAQTGEDVIWTLRVHRLQESL